MTKKRREKRKRQKCESDFFLLPPGGNECEWEKARKRERE